MSEDSAAAAVRAMIASGQEEALLRALALPPGADGAAPGVRGDIVERLSDPWNALRTFGLFREAASEIVALRVELSASAFALHEAGRALDRAGQTDAAHACRASARRALAEGGDGA